MGKTLPVLITVIFLIMITAVTGCQSSSSTTTTAATSATTSIRVEVSRQTIISLEGGRYNPSILLAFRLAQFFQMKIEEIFIYSQEENENEKQ